MLAPRCSTTRQSRPPARCQVLVGKYVRVQRQTDGRGEKSREIREKVRRRVRRRVRRKLMRRLDARSTIRAPRCSSTMLSHSSSPPSRCRREGQEATYQWVSSGNGCCSEEDVWRVSVRRVDVFAVDDFHMLRRGRSRESVPSAKSLKWTSFDLRAKAILHYDTAIIIVIMEQGADLKRMAPSDAVDDTGSSGGARPASASNTMSRIAITRTVAEKDVSAAREKRVARTITDTQAPIHSGAVETPQRDSITPWEPSAQHRQLHGAAKALTAYGAIETPRRSTIAALISQPPESMSEQHRIAATASGNYGAGGYGTVSGYGSIGGASPFKSSSAQRMEHIGTPAYAQPSAVETPQAERRAATLFQQSEPANHGQQHTAMPAGGGYGDGGSDVLAAENQWLRQQLAQEGARFSAATAMQPGHSFYRDRFIETVDAVHQYYTIAENKRIEAERAVEEARVARAELEAVKMEVKRKVEDLEAKNAWLEAAGA